MNELMNLNTLLAIKPQWAILPDVVLLILLGFVLINDLFLGDAKRWITEATTLVGLIFIFILQLFVTFSQFDLGYPLYVINTMWINDPFGNFSKLVMYVVVFVILIYGKNYTKDQGIYNGEYYSLILFALLGMNVMVSANHFLLLYIGLELLSLSLYALIGLRRHSVHSSEAALKYFVLGSLASGILLYGISLIYGATGQLGIAQIAYIAHHGIENSVLLLLGLIFIIVGIAFKFGAVPFHMWVPDVYQGAPTSVAAFIGSAPKIAVVIFAIRILVAGLGSTYDDWHLMLQILAVASILLGNLAAIVQTNIKRMLGFSTISHMGFIILGLSANNALLDSAPDGIFSALFYTLAYVLMSLVAFAVIIAISSKNKECENIADLSGLNKKHPLLAFMMLLSMFSMAGIPPLMGFYAKFYVINVLVANGFIALSIFAVIMSLIGAFYYLRVVKVMYFDDVQDEIQSNLSSFAKIILLINSFALLYFGMFPELILQLFTF